MPLCVVKIQSAAYPYSVPRQYTTASSPGSPREVVHSHSARLWREAAGHRDMAYMHLLLAYAAQIPPLRISGRRALAALGHRRAGPFPRRKRAFPATLSSASLSAHPARVSSGASQAVSPPRPVFYYSDTYEHPLPASPAGKPHRFPMDKYRAVREALERDPVMAGVSFRCAPLAAREDVTLVHDPEYFDRFVAGRVSDAEVRAVGFPWSRAGVRRSLASTGGTVAATRELLRNPRMRIAGQTAGGTHHAFRGHGSGFCVFNDIAVAAAVALSEFGLQRVLVVDADTHQGDGTARVCGAMLPSDAPC